MKKNKDKHKHKYGMNLLRLAKRKIGNHATLTDLAKGADIHDSTLHYIAIGKNSPSMATLHQLAAYFRMNVGELLVEITKNT